jgi:hypothetical protein
MKLIKGHKYRVINNSIFSPLVSIGSIGIAIANYSLAFVGTQQILCEPTTLYVIDLDKKPSEIKLYGIAKFCQTHYK